MEQQITVVKVLQRCKLELKFTSEISCALSFEAVACYHRNVNVLWSEFYNFLLNWLVTNRTWDVWAWLLDAPSVVFAGRFTKPLQMLVAQYSLKVFAMLISSIRITILYSCPTIANKQSGIPCTLKTYFQRIIIF